MTKSSGAKTRSPTSFAKCTGHIATLCCRAAEVRPLYQLRSASSIGLRPGLVSSKATDPPPPSRPTMCPHISSNAPHNRGSARLGISSIWANSSAHHRTRFQEGDPEPRLAEAQRPHQRSPALVQVLGGADARHFKWLP